MRARYGQESDRSIVAVKVEGHLCFALSERVPGPNHRHRVQHPERRLRCSSSKYLHDIHHERLTNGTHG